MTNANDRDARPLLSAAMIVRDEEALLDECLSSLEGIVDQLVVVDTGSVDDTVDIACAHGASVSTEPWQHDFSRARNAALSRATGEWVLSIDADERLAPVERDRVAALLRSPDYVAYRVQLRPFAGATPYREHRLWRNDPRIRFEGIIHERVAPSIHRVAEEDHRLVGLCDLTIDHLGYHGDQTRKHQRNVPLLKRHLEAEPHNVFSWRHLAHAHYGLGQRSEGDEALRRALAAIRSAGSAPPVGALVYADLVEQGRGNPESKALLDEGLQRYPRDPVLWWMKAAMELDDAQPAAALRWLDRLAATDASLHADTMSYDRKLFGTWAHAARGLSLFQLGEYTAAADAFRIAGRDASADDATEYRVKRLMAEHLARQRTRVGAVWSRTVDLADVAVLFCTDAPDHAAAVEAAVGPLPSTDSAPEIAVTVHCALPPDEPVEWQHTDGLVSVRWEPDAMVLGHGPTRARVDETSAMFLGENDVTRAFRQLLPYAATYLLATRDRFVLHAGAIVRDGETVLVLGASRGGKSSLVVSAMSSGWAALGDDLVAIRLEGSRVEARGIAKPMLAPADVVLRTGLPHTAVAGDARTRAVVQADAADDLWYPVRGTIVSAVGADEPWVIDSADLFRWLLFSYLATGDERRLSLFLPVASALTRLGGGAIRHGPRTTAHGMLIESVLAQMQELRGSSGTADEPRPPPDSSTSSSSRRS